MGSVKKHTKKIQATHAYKPLPISNELKHAKSKLRQTTHLSSHKRNM
uniref:Uncharacterized protein n=1 Tax=Anguilla anguilla TaxID=7936 RepID=A0A0E9W413_ANGAN